MFESFKKKKGEKGEVNLRRREFLKKSAVAGAAVATGGMSIESAAIEALYNPEDGGEVVCDVDSAKEALEHLLDRPDRIEVFAEGKIEVTDVIDEGNNLLIKMEFDGTEVTAVLTEPHLKRNEQGAPVADKTILGGIMMIALEEAGALEFKAGN